MTYDALNTPALSQRDPKWANLALRAQPETIGLYGCYVVCMSMIDGKSPDAMAWDMRLEKRFAVSSSKVLTFETLPDSKYSLKRVTSLMYGPVPSNELINLAGHLGAGSPAVFEVRLRLADGKLSQHFVLAVARYGFSPNTYGFIVNDPWVGLQYPLCPEYGINPARAIYRILYYGKRTNS